ncbi:MAG: restriction endonuclease, partial [Methanosarcinales archaeon]
KSLRGQINNLLGKNAELMLRRVVSGFNNQIISGKYFNSDKEVLLTKFDRSASDYEYRTPTSIQIGIYQIDLYAKKTTKNEIIIWLIESKNWQNAVGSKEVKEFLEKIKVVSEQENPNSLIGWFYSKSGFKTEAIKLLKQHNILFSNQTDVVELIQELGI